MQKVRPGQVVAETMIPANDRSREMISSIFVDRPRLAFVVSIVITLAGLIAITRFRSRNSPTSCRRR